jgi:hypothetical protein
MKKYISVSPQMFMLNNLERFFTSNYKGNVLSAVATAVSKLGHEQASVCKIQRILKRFEQYIKERASNDFEGKKNATLCRRQQRAAAVLLNHLHLCSRRRAHCCTVLSVDNTYFLY